MNKTYPPNYDLHVIPEVPTKQSYKLRFSRNKKCLFSDGNSPPSFVELGKEWKSLEEVKEHVASCLKNKKYVTKDSKKIEISSMEVVESLHYENILPLELNEKGKECMSKMKQSLEG